MRKIYSKIKTNKLLHLIHRIDESKNERENIAPENEYLQLAILKMNKGRTFEAHKHIIKEKITDIAQESWLVFKGSVKCLFYDLDDTLLEEVILKEGDISMTFSGGHNYLIMEDNTVVFEYKTGPYLGIKNDKQFLNHKK